MKQRHQSIDGYNDWKYHVWPIRRREYKEWACERNRFHFVRYFELGNTSRHGTSVLVVVLVFKSLVFVFRVAAFCSRHRVIFIIYSCTAMHTVSQKLSTTLILNISVKNQPKICKLYMKNLLKIYVSKIIKIGWVVTEIFKKSCRRFWYTV